MGVAHVLTKPVRARLLISILERTVDKPSVPTPPLAPVRSSLLVESAPAAAFAAPQGALQALEFSRRFSAILTHSLDAEAMLKKFLLLLREIVGVNRAAIFLQEPAAVFGEKPGEEGKRSLRKVAPSAWPPGCWSISSFRWRRASAGTWPGRDGFCGGTARKHGRTWKSSRNSNCWARKSRCRSWTARG